MKAFNIIVLLICAGVFNSCNSSFVPFKSEQRQISVSGPVVPTASGTYLAGHVAHIRQDYDAAADYYLQSVNLGTDNPYILTRTYLILTAQGRIKEASDLLKKHTFLGQQSNIVYFIVMTDHLQNKRYDEALKSLNNINNIYIKDTVLPLFRSWIYAGKNQKEKALSELEPLKKDSGFLSVYYLHQGLIYDYFDDTSNAQKAYDKILKDKNLNLSFRSLQLISNFYIRSGQKEKISEIIKEYKTKNNSLKTLAELYTDILETPPDNVKKIIDSSQKGEAEALFFVGLISKSYSDDIAQLYTSLALYLNPVNEIARISLGETLEENRRFEDAVKQYMMIKPESSLYFLSRLKIASIYMNQKDNQKAHDFLAQLLTEYPDNYRILFNLAEISRMMDKSSEAINYYNRALQLVEGTNQENWMLYYALGIAYERNNEWEKAEKHLKKALQMSNRHPFVLNYLGYTWLKNNQNYNEALYMIFDAYQKNPENGHIIDSLGWALYRMGHYNDSIKVLERAAEYLPSNAIVCDHLGDAYWQAGRKTEAVFQWKHALTLKEDSEEINKPLIEQKIADGLEKPATINYNEPLLVQRLKSLKIDH